MKSTETITVEALIKADLKRVWHLWTEPVHIKKWNQASDYWHSPRAENDLRPGGRFTTRMEAKDGSAGFDFSGVYDEVKTEERIAYTLEDGRRVMVNFEKRSDGVKVTEEFDPDTQNSAEMQRSGWQAILDNFKKYAESIGE